MRGSTGPSVTGRHGDLLAVRAFYLGGLPPPCRADRLDRVLTLGVLVSCRAEDLVRSLTSTDPRRAVKLAAPSW